jgi:hypothetical protein
MERSQDCNGYNWYSIERFGVRFNRLHILLFYGIPVALFVLICVTTQWTGLAFHVDAEGYSHTGPLFDGLFYWLVLAYFFAPSIVGIYFLTIGKSRKPADGDISVSLFVFTAMTPVLYFLEVGFVGVEAEDYSTMTLPVALALVYFITNTSTRTVLKTQAHMEAVETDLRIASKIQADALPPVAAMFWSMVKTRRSISKLIWLRCSVTTTSLSSLLSGLRRSVPISTRCPLATVTF